MMDDQLSWEILKQMRHSDICIVIGNGPSLNAVPRDFLYKHDTFGTNRIYLKFVPEFYAAVNPLVVEQWIEDIQALDSTAKFVPVAFSGRVAGAFPLVSKPLAHFAREPWKGIYEGFTVTYVALQLAFYMGYRTVLLVGVDHRYKFDGQPNQEKVLEGDDPNHFDKSYFRGMRWNNPDLERSELAYQMAKTNFEQDGRRIINLGPDSALEIFERGKLEEWS
jgi:hypothetical protein